MTTATLRGKLDAESPHVRFDGGKVAPAKPRRGSPFYKKMMGLFAVAAAVTLRAEVTTFQVGEGEADRTITAGEVSALVESGNDLEKTGGGRLIIDKSLKGYKGEIRIKAGYLLAKHLEAFGDPDKGTVVESDATLEFDVPDGTTKNSTLKFGPEQVKFEGIGVGGCGALRYVNTKWPQYCQVFSNLTMTGNARISGARTKTDAHSDSQRWDIRGNGFLDMNGHTLEIAGQFGLAGASIVNPGNINLTAVHGYGTLCLEGGNVKLNGSAANVITVPAYTKLAHQTPKAYDWSVTFDGGVFNENNKSEASTYLTTGCINGTFTVTENGVTLYGSTTPATHLTVGGSVDVKGPIYCKSNPASLSLVVVQAADEADAAALERVSELRKHFSEVDYCRLDDNFKIVLHTTAGSRTQPLAAGGDASGILSAALSGNAALALTGNQTLDELRLGDGYYRLTGADKTHHLGQLTLNGDTELDVTGGSIDTEVDNVFVGASYPSVAKLRLENSSYVTNWTKRTGNVPPVKVGQRRRMGTSDDSGSVTIADTATGRGVIEVAAGGVFTNTLWLGRVTTDYGVKQNETTAWCQGAFYLRDGGTAMLFSKDYNVFVGSCGCGYVEQSGGTLRTQSLFYLGAGTHGRGIWYQTGGTVVNEGNVIMGNYSRTTTPSKGVLWISGGTFTAWSAICSGKTRYDTANTGNQDQITVSGTGFLDVDNGIDLAGTTDAKTTVNLNGGTTYAHFMQVLTNELQTQMTTGEFREYTGNSARVNFNGGTYRYRRNANKSGKVGYKAESFFYGDPDRLTLTSYGKGAIFQVDEDLAANLNHSLRAPSGRGIASLALPADFGDIPDGAYIGAPSVEIDGDGVGATAVATFDSALGRVTGVVVTSPGCDYTAATAKLVRGGYTNAVDLVVTLGESVSGGLTKTGAGTLRLNAANTYTGKTTVCGGTLAVTEAAAIPSASEVVLQGGTLDAGGFAHGYGVISCATGSLVNACGSYTRFVKTGAGAATFDVPLTGADAVIEIQEGTLRLPVKIPGFCAGEKIYADEEETTELNNRTPLKNLGIELEPTRTHYTTSDGYFKPRHYLTYSGYLWNSAATNRTVTFAHDFDDSVYLYVDGEQVTMTTTVVPWKWGALYTGSVTLAPGAHAVKFLFWNGPGNGGAVVKGNMSGCTNWRNDIIGFSWDPEGRGTTDGNNFERLADPGDGSLVTATADDGKAMPTFGTLKFAAGTTLDLSGGTLAFAGAVEVSKDVKGGEPVSVNGALAFGEGATLTVPDIQLDQGESVVLMEASAGFSGVKPTVAYGYTLHISANRLVLSRPHGLLLMIR